MSSASNVTLHVADDAHATVAAIHAALREKATACMNATGRFVVALAGGSTPAALYRALATAQGRLDWPRTLLLFGDERAVPPEHADSNYRMVKTALLDPGNVPTASVRRIAGEFPAGEAALRYEALLRTELSSAAELNVALLGLGDDAHTASLFPGTPALDETERWVVANPIAKLGAERITMTYPLLNGAGEAWFLVTGAGKAEAVARLLDPTADRHAVPSAGVRPGGGVRLWLDAAAASQLPR